MAITTTPNFGFQMSDGNDTFDYDKFIKGNFQKVEDNAVKKQSYTPAPAPLFNGWSDDVTYPSKYWKDSDETVTFSINAHGGYGAAINAVSVLPAGFRPDSRQLFIGYCEASNSTSPSTVLFEVTPAGNIQQIRDLQQNGFVVYRGSFKAVN